jgi:hypothetical protein
MKAECVFVRACFEGELDERVLNVGIPVVLGRPSAPVVFPAGPHNAFQARYRGHGAVRETRGAVIRPGICKPPPVQWRRERDRGRLKMPSLVSKYSNTVCEALYGIAHCSHVVALLVFLDIAEIAKEDGPVDVLERLELFGRAEASAVVRIG